MSQPSERAERQQRRWASRSVGASPAASAAGSDVSDLPDLEEPYEPEFDQTEPASPVGRTPTEEEAPETPDSVLRAVFNAFRGRLPFLHPTRTPSPISSPPTPPAAFLWPDADAIFDEPLTPSFSPTEPPAPPPSPIPEPAAVMALQYRTMNLKYPKFSSAPFQDPDDHCIMFEETYFLNNPGVVTGALTAVEQLQMKRTFTTTMIGAAQAWVTQYIALTTYEQLKTEFLGTFRLQPTAAHILNSLNNLKQSRRLVYAYAAEIRKLVNRLDGTNRPSDLVQCETFLRGLDNNDPHIGMDLTGQTLDALVERVVKADRLKTPITPQYGSGIANSGVSQPTGGYGQGYPAPVWQYSGASVPEAQGGAGAAAVIGPAGGVMSLPFRPGVWCTSCAKEGHFDVECPDRAYWCDICSVNTHPTSRCVYNGRVRPAKPQHSRCRQ